MIRRPPRSTHCISSAASDVYKRQVYNQSNDRYFTKSSLNTQGVGIIMKKDFTTLRDLFGRKKKKTAKKSK